MRHADGGDALNQHQTAELKQICQAICTLSDESLVRLRYTSDKLCASTLAPTPAAEVFFDALTPARIGECLNKIKHYTTLNIDDAAQASFESWPLIILDTHQRWHASISASLRTHTRCMLDPAEPPDREPWIIDLLTRLSDNRLLLGYIVDDDDSALKQALRYFQGHLLELHKHWRLLTMISETLTTDDDSSDSNDNTDSDASAPLFAPFDAAFGELINDTKARIVQYHARLCELCAAQIIPLCENQALNLKRIATQTHTQNSANADADTDTDTDALTDKQYSKQLEALTARRHANDNISLTCHFALETYIKRIEDLADCRRSLLNPTPAQTIKPLKELLVQLQQDLQQSRSKPNHKPTRYKILTQAIRRECAGLKSRFDLPECQTFYARITRLSNGVNGFFEPTATTTHSSSIDDLAALAGRCVIQCRWFCEIICPLRYISNSDLVWRNAHYGYATNNRSPLGDLAHKITSGADKALAEKLCNDRLFLACTISSSDRFYADRQNPKLKRIIGKRPASNNSSDSSDTPSTCMGLLAALRRQLPPQQLPFLVRIETVINKERPLEQIDGDALRTILDDFEAEKAKAQPALAEKYQQLYDQLETLAELTTPMTFFDNKNHYLGIQPDGSRNDGNAQECIIDYGKWLISRVEVQAPLSRYTVAQLGPLIVSLINLVASDINALSGDATTCAYGALNKRSRQQIQAQYREYIESYDGDDTPSMEGFLRSKAMTRIFGKPPPRTRPASTEALAGSGGASASASTENSHNSSYNDDDDHDDDDTHTLSDDNCAQLMAIPISLFQLLNKVALLHELTVLLTALGERKDDDFSTDWIKWPKLVQILQDSRKHRLFMRFSATLFIGRQRMLLAAHAAKRHSPSNPSFGRSHSTSALDEAAAAAAAASDSAAPATTTTTTTSTTAAPPSPAQACAAGVGGGGSGSANSDTLVPAALANSHTDTDAEQVKNTDVKEIVHDQAYTPAHETHTQLVLQPAELLSQLYALCDKLQPLIPNNMQKHCPRERTDGFYLMPQAPKQSASASPQHSAR